jgi:hypothetical protein
MLGKPEGWNESFSPFLLGKMQAKLNSESNDAGCDATMLH